MISETARFFTRVGASMPSLYVAEEVQNNRFKISGGVGGKKVSWMLMGQKNDPWLKNNPAKDVMDKPEEAAGTYLYPQGHGQRESLSLTSVRMQSQSDPEKRDWQAVTTNWIKR